MFEVGDMVKFRNETAEIIQVDTGDRTFPYEAMRTDGTTFWASENEISSLDPVYSVSEDDVNAVKVTVREDGDYETEYLLVDAEYNTPGEVRVLIERNQKIIAQYEAIARAMEAEPDPEEAAKAIYYKAFPEGTGYAPWDDASPSLRVMARTLAEARK